MSRTVIVGDLHGCRGELEDLLRWVGFRPRGAAGRRADQLVLVGDLLTRGPDPSGTVRLLRALGARAVRGNHDERLLLAAAGRLPAGDGYAKLARRALAGLGADDLAWLRALPLSVDLPEHDVRVVHAGLEPGVPFEEQTRETLLHLRTVPEGEAPPRPPHPSPPRLGPKGPLAPPGRRPWASHYEGPPHVVFGHHALAGLQLHEWATGLDTGCVYGGHLTAMVLLDGERPPPPARRLEVIVSVPARRCWARG